MIKSMTGYARLFKTTPFGRVVLEIHSINKRELEIALYLPRNYLAFDLPLREWVQESVLRGQVTVRLQIEGKERGAPAKLGALKAAKAKWDKIALGLGLDPKQEITLPFLLEQIGSEEIGELKESELKALTEEVLQALRAMQEREGKALSRDVKERLAFLVKSLKVIEKGAGKAAKRYEERLKEKIREYAAQDLDERLLREVVVFADRCDVTEEIVRLKSHFEQFALILKSDEGSVGRTLEFLTQEIQRELSTLSAKISDASLVHIALEMKNELGKMREQIRNIV